MRRNSKSEETKKKVGLNERKGGCSSVLRSVEWSSPNDDHQYVEVQDSLPPIKEGALCKGKECKRVYCAANQRYQFKPINCDALTDVSYLGSLRANSMDEGFCQLCGPLELNDMAHQICKFETERRKTCCQKFFELKDYEHLSEECAPKKLNPIWTGEDPDQIGVFIRNLKIEAVNEEKQTISLHFILNVVWLDEDLCAHVKTKEGIEKEEWFIQMSKDEYIKSFNAVQRGQSEDVDQVDNALTVEKYHNPLPNIKIWNGSTKEGYEIREEVVSLNKKHIGPNTVYWRRIMRVKLLCEYTSRGFPFGYETFKMSIRLMSRTNQHLVLLRTKLWHDVHMKQCPNKTLVDHTFAYMHPDNKGLKDWKVCSIHNNRDKFWSKFDNNDLTFRLPVRVTDGKDTQSRYEALLILKRKPTYVLWNIWFYFTLTTVLSLLTYQIDVIDDLPDRLAIAVGIIFVQMGLKWDSSRKTARVSYITGLDMHIFLSISLVVGQAVGQVISAAICNHWASDREKVTKEADVILFWISLVSVCIVNLGTFSLSKSRQRWTRKSLEQKLQKFTGFNKYPLTGSNENAIGSMVQLSGMQKKDPFQLQISRKEIEEKVERFQTNYQNVNDGGFCVL